jgi:hypothetical protein
MNHFNSSLFALSLTLRAAIVLKILLVIGSHSNSGAIQNQVYNRFRQIVVAFFLQNSDQNRSRKVPGKFDDLIHSIFWINAKSLKKRFGQNLQTRFLSLGFLFVLPQGFETKILNGFRINFYTLYLSAQNQLTWSMQSAKKWSIYGALVIGFLIILSIGFLLTGRLIAYFETPSRYLETNDQNFDFKELYYPLVEWDSAQPEGRNLEEPDKNKITQDYIAADFFYQNYLNKGDSAALPFYFTEQQLEKIKAYKESLSALGQSVSTTAISHKITPKLFSEDGTLIAFEDKQVAYLRAKVGDQYFPSLDTSLVDVLIILEDNYWKIRQRKRLLLKKKDIITTQHKRPESRIEIKGETFAFEGKPWLAKGINYYPARSPWQQFWEEFDTATVAQDFQLIASGRFNTVRIFIPYQQFGGASVKDEYLVRLAKLLEIAENKDLKIIITLFDFFLGYQVKDWTHSFRQASVLVQRFKDHPAILAWDIKNEPDLDFENFGDYEVMEWLRVMALHIKSIAPNAMLTVGWSDAEHINVLKENLDILSFHFYGNPTELETILKQDYGKPLFLQEAGAHSFDPWWYPLARNQIEQQKYISEIGDLLIQNPVSFAWWTLYDFKKVPSNVAGSGIITKGIQKNFGLRENFASPKPAWKVAVDLNQKLSDRELNRIR